MLTKNKILEYDMCIYLIKRPDRFHFTVFPAMLDALAGEYVTS